ncbi:MAG: TetR/AcrR family transcriptional regulator [Burkholderiaceae bacterium]
MPCLFKHKPRWARRKEARPQELLAAALDQFVARGYAAARLEDVARQAGVSKGTLYLYFANKEELFKAVVRENMLPVLGEAAQIIDRYDGSSADLFREILHGWWQRVGATQLSGISKLMIAESGNFPALAKFYHDEVIVPGKALIVRMLEHGVARGEFRQHDARRTAEVVVAPMLMLMLWKHSFHSCQPEAFAPNDYLDNFIDLCLHGLLADGAT